MDNGLEARRAGCQPKNTPTRVEKSTATSTCDADRSMQKLPAAPASFTPYTPKAASTTTAAPPGDYLCKAPLW